MSEESSHRWWKHGRDLLRAARPLREEERLTEEAEAAQTRVVQWLVDLEPSAERPASGTADPSGAIVGGAALGGLGIAAAGRNWREWLVDVGLAGVGPLPSAAVLAQQYRRRPYANDRARVRSLIRWACAKNGATGFVAGLGGLLTLPVALPSSLAGSLMIRMTMIGAIAILHGRDVKDDDVRTMMLLCLIGTKTQEIAKIIGEEAAKRLTLAALKALPGSALIEINKKVGFRLLTKFGEKGVVNLVKGVPIAGGVVGGVADTAGCYAAGRAADRAFRP